MTSCVGRGICWLVFNYISLYSTTGHKCFKSFSVSFDCASVTYLTITKVANNEKNNEFIKDNNNDEETIIWK